MQPAVPEPASSGTPNGSLGAQMKEDKEPAILTSVLEESVEMQRASLGSD